MSCKIEILAASPILYSLQNCPYAMRARLALLLAQQTVQIRAITMNDKPSDMLLASPPVLVIGKDQVIDESLDVMLWALNCNDPENLLYSHDKNALPEMLKIIEQSDNEFKPNLEKYKRAKRFHSDDEEAYRLRGGAFVNLIEMILVYSKICITESHLTKGLKVNSVCK
ncbi:MAG: glutathione S-transferase N-terminal domain-containing protein [Cocleimonas sp.]|nr:glutathione S-transferase N-terminal domain-containing protein [Cocleimonas sp.]